MENQGIRWKQRFQNLEKAYLKFQHALQAQAKEPQNELYQMALVQAFEFTFELGWKTVKDFLVYSGVKGVSLPRDVIKQGFHFQVIEDGQLWIDMMQDKNLMAHTYSEENAQKALAKITGQYSDGIRQVYTYLKDRWKEK